jgi:ubiquinone/menaquinone biosynthesis C-methylase UbiE
MKILNQYFKNLYARTMREAYQRAHQEILSAMQDGGNCLHCGANTGHQYNILNEKGTIEQSRYFGIEWNADLAKQAQDRGLQVTRGDLNQNLDFPDNSFRCMFGLSVLEHLLYPCSFMKECHRCLEENGSLVLLTPNISTYFTAALILAGKMPSSGPHPDSEALHAQESLFVVNNSHKQANLESDNPPHRHLIVFSFKVLRSYLNMIGFRDVRGYGYGLYPLPNFMQPVAQKLDPTHCHQMVFIARK